jgi:hypothetical protein
MKNNIWKKSNIQFSKFNANSNYGKAVPLVPLGLVVKMFNNISKLLMLNKARK